MTSLTGLPDLAGPGSPVRARSRHDAKDQGRPAVNLLADPRVRLGLGAVATLITATWVRSDRVGRREARAFRAVNGLPDGLHVPFWIVMQLGTLGAAPTAAGAAWLAHDRKLALRLLAGGSTTWALSKLVKQQVGRPRPAALVPGARCRGPEACGLGYLSGHAGVATALGVAAFPRLGATGRAITATIVPIVGLSRVYVGAHLPLDIVGGAALGLAVDAAVTWLGGPAARVKHHGDSGRTRSGVLADGGSGSSAAPPRVAR